MLIAEACGHGDLMTLIQERQTLSLGAEPDLRQRGAVPFGECRNLFRAITRCGEQQSVIIARCRREQATFP